MKITVNQSLNGFGFVVTACASSPALNFYYIFDYFWETIIKFVLNVRNVKHNETKKTKVLGRAGSADDKTCWYIAVT